VRVARLSQLVMPGLVPDIHVLNTAVKKDVDGRVKPGHDEDHCFAVSAARAFFASVASHTIRLPRSRPNSSIGS